MGDFQEDALQCSLSLRLLVHGWKIPLHLDAEGNERPPTFVMGQCATSIDSVILSPDNHATIPCIMVQSVGMLTHRVLAFPLSFQAEQLHTRVAGPPRLHWDAPLHPVSDWKPCIELLDHRYQSLEQDHRQGGWTPTHVIVDEMRGIFEGHFREHLSKNGCKIQLSDGSTDDRLQLLGNAQVHWKTVRKRAHGTSNAIILHKAVAWLVSLARNEGCDKVRCKLERHRQLIVASFRLAPGSFESALTQPASFVGPWKEQLRLYKHRCDQRAMRAWRAKLFTRKARPTKTLFRWLRNVPPTNNMCLKAGDSVVSGPVPYFIKAVSIGKPS